MGQCASQPARQTGASAENPARRPDGDSASARATVAADESCELRRPANGRAADPLQTKQQTAGKRVASLDVVASVPADAARDDDRDSPSLAGSYESHADAISEQQSAILDAQEGEKRVSLDVRRYDLSGGKESPVSSFRSKEDVILPAVPSITSGGGTAGEEVESIGSARSDMVPAPPPVWLTMEKGPVPAPCRAKAAVVDDIIRGHMDNGEDPALEHVLQLACMVFKAEAAAVTLMGKDRYYVSGGVGGCVKQIGQDVPWLSAMCGYTLTPQHHEVLVIEDMLEDARFNKYGLERWPFERFYCGCPLVTTNGFRVGTLCLGGDNPRKMTAHEINVLCNMTEVVIRRIEQAWAVNIAKRDAEQRLSRALSAYETPLLFVDAGEEGRSPPQDWNIMYLNDAASTALGANITSVVNKRFEDVFVSATSAQVPWKMYSSKAAAAQSFVMKRLGLQLPGASTQLWSLSFRPAAVDALDDNQIRVGIPSYVDEEGGAAFKARYFFAELAKDVRNSVDLPSSPCKTPPSPAKTGSRSPAGSDKPMRSPLRKAGSRPLAGALMPQVPSALEGLELGPIVGKGSYGSVYRGSYQKQHVAVKVMCTKDVKFSADGRPLEAALAEGLEHPGIVRTIATAVTGFGAADASGETWLVMELCNGGDLQAAVDRGLLRTGKRTQYDPADMGKVLDIAGQVAAGLQHLHARGIVHGDLTGGNVMLQRSRQDPAGFKAKIADFGMARDFSVQDRIQTRMYGTVTHMPPELIQNGIASKAVDVYALGVLLWEMHHGCRAWAGMTQSQIIHAVAICKQRLTFARQLSDSQAVVAYFHLADACLACDPDARPSIDAVVSQLAAIDAQYNREPQPIGMATQQPAPSPYDLPSAALPAYSPNDLLFAAAK